MRNCSFENCSAGVITAQYSTTIHDIGSIYTLNTFSTKRASLLFFDRSVANFTHSRFSENFVVENSIIHTKRSTITLRQCKFSRNNGEGLLMSYNSNISLYDSNLTHNFASSWLSLLQIFTTNLTVNNTTLAYNVGQTRATILKARDSIITSANILLPIINASHITATTYLISVTVKYHLGE